MGVQRRDFAVRHDLNEVTVKLVWDPDGTVRIEAIGRSSTKRGNLWSAHISFPHDEGPLVPIDEIYSLLSDCQIARPVNQPEYDEARAYEGQVTMPLPW